MKKIEALIFDLDGTLIDSRTDISEAVNFTLEKFDLPELPRRIIIDYVGDGSDKLIERALKRSCAEKGMESPEKIDCSEALKIFSDYYREHYLDNTVLYDGVKDVLNYFSSIPMAVMSNKGYEFTEKILDGLEISQFFRVIMGGDSLPVRKPDPLPVLKIIEKIKCNPELTVIVGDSGNDILAGKRAGTITCAVTYGLRSKSALLEFSPDYLIDRIQELKDLFNPRSV
ncbi:MAG: HAD family hydrolase [Fidelibacterota bacterium]